MNELMCTPEESGHGVKLFKYMKFKRVIITQMKTVIITAPSIYQINPIGYHLLPSMVTSFPVITDYPMYF
jgi:hypothetical protein